ncbi:MAG: ABC transporter ATP-binding protein [Acidobacteria bacterium]|nr:ABC transporter ATP-binding protein [Acidobacteriota bacterium]
MQAPVSPHDGSGRSDGAAVVELRGVSVIYGRQTALRDVSAAFPPGAVGLLGPNGAGKSTMLKALLGFVVPSQGEMRVLGLDVATSALDIRARLGYMPESDAHIPGMSAVAFVAYCGQLAGLPPADAMQRAHEVLYYVGLGEARYRNVETYSTGMKQRIKLAQALVHDPDLLFLDEPTNGMDPKGRDEMLELIRDLAHNKGVNLIVSSHLLPDIEFTCDHVIVMDKGAVATQGALDAVRGPQGRVFELRVKDGAEQMLSLLTAAGYEVHDTQEDVMRVFVPGAAGAEPIFRLAAANGLQVRHLKQSVPTLEDAFARAVGAD